MRPKRLEKINISFGLSESTRARSVPFLISSGMFSCKINWSPDNKDDFSDAEFLLWNVSHFGTWLPERQKSRAMGKSLFFGVYLLSAVIL